MSTVKQNLRSFILQNFLFTDNEEALRDNVSFLETGIIDSTGILEVIEFIGEEFGVTVEDDELIPENLDSIDNLTAFIARKKELLSSECGNA